MQRIMKENKWASDQEIRNKDMKINSPAYNVELSHTLIQILYLFRDSQPIHILCFSVYTTHIPVEYSTIIRL